MEIDELWKQVVHECDLQEHMSDIDCPEETLQGLYRGIAIAIHNGSYVTVYDYMYPRYYVNRPCENSYQCRGMSHFSADTPVEKVIDALKKIMQEIDRLIDEDKYQVYSPDILIPGCYKISRYVPAGMDFIKNPDTMYDRFIDLMDDLLSFMEGTREFRKYENTGDAAEYIKRNYLTDYHMDGHGLEIDGIYVLWFQSEDTIGILRDVLVCAETGEYFKHYIEIKANRLSDLAMGAILKGLREFAYTGV